MRRSGTFVEHAKQIVGDRLALQSNDLHAGHAKVEAPDNTAFINSYNGRIITGFEMRSQSQKPDASRVMGAAGDPLLALRRSIDKGMAPNPSGRHVDYLEIYVGDVLPADMQPVLSYGASLFTGSRSPRIASGLIDTSRGFGALSGCQILVTNGPEALSKACPFQPR